MGGNREEYNRGRGPDGGIEGCKVCVRINLGEAAGLKKGGKPFNREAK